MAADQNVDFLLIGGGMASAHCAAELRKQGVEGSILLVGREQDPPYERPPLSKEYLRGEAERSEALVHPAEWYADSNVELMTGRNVMSLDTAERVAKLQGGEEVGFARALIATGAMVNLLRLDGAQLEGIHYLRAFGNADGIRAAAEEAGKAILIGGSYIATEVAASLTAKGVECVLVMQEEVVLSNSFGEEVGSWFHDLLESKGVEIHGGEELAEFLGEERVSGVRTKSGLELAGEAVIVGAGVRPDVMLAQKAGLEVDDGIVCDSGLETSVEGIFAAGDCCSWQSEIHGRRLRVEHWDVAMQQGRHVAKAMAGAKEPYRVVPYFFSDLADWASLEYVGPAADWDEVIWRGSRDAGEFSAWFLQGGKVAAALSVGRSEDLSVARELIESGADVSARKDEIADVDADLDSLVS